MTEKDIREAWGKVYPEEEPAIDFALDMVRKHNAELARYFYDEAQRNPSNSVQLCQVGRDIEGKCP